LKHVFIVGLVVVLGLVMGISLNASAEESLIPAWVKGVANFWVEGNISDSEFGESISFLIEQNIITVELPLESGFQNTDIIRNLEVENKKLQNEVKELKNKIISLEIQNNLLSKLSSPDYNPPAYNPPAYNPPAYNPPTYYDSNEIRYDVDDVLNIGGLSVHVNSFGFLEPNTDEFSIDMSLKYTRGGSPVEFYVSQIKVTTDDNYSYVASSSDFLALNGMYSHNVESKAIVIVNGVPRDLDGDFEILVTVEEYGNYGGGSNSFTFPYSLS
jgi:hypothetical protein